VSAYIKKATQTTFKLPTFKLSNLQLSTFKLPTFKLPTFKLETMSHTNTELKKAIKEHFAKQGKRLTNLSKCVNFQLLDIIEKYNIELPEPVKKERKKPEKKEQLETTNHPFRLGEFEYHYELDEENGCYKKHFSIIQYKITKITKCFLTIEYVYKKGCIDERMITKKCKIDFSDYSGWFFTLDTRMIIHTKDTKTIEEKEQERLFNWAIGKVRRVWRHYH
jgi:hypothetical protein